MEMKDLKCCGNCKYLFPLKNECMWNPSTAMNAPPLALRACKLCNKWKYDDRLEKDRLEKDRLEKII